MEGLNVLCEIIEVVTFHSFFGFFFFFLWNIFKIEAVQHGNMHKLYKICRSFKIYPQRWSQRSSLDPALLGSCTLSNSRHVLLTISYKVWWKETNINKDAKASDASWNCSFTGEQCHFRWNRITSDIFQTKALIFRRRWNPWMRTSAT